MMTGIEWADDHGLSQELRLTVRQPCKAPITSYINQSTNNHLMARKLPAVKSRN